MREHGKGEKAGELGLIGFIMQQACVDGSKLFQAHVKLM